MVNHLLSLLKPTFRLLALADLAKHDNEFARVPDPHFAGRQFQRNFRARAVPAARLARPRAGNPFLPGLEVCRDEIAVPALIRIRHQYLHVPADQFRFRIAEDMPDGTVGRFDEAPFVDGDDPVGNVVHDALQPGIAIRQVPGPFPNATVEIGVGEPKFLFRLLPFQRFGPEGADGPCDIADLVGAVLVRDDVVQPGAAGDFEHAPGDRRQRPGHRPQRPRGRDQHGRQLQQPQNQRQP